MMGKLIVIDGLDGCGKKTQVERLENKLKQMGKKVYRVSFPDYDSNSSEAVKIYLNGELGKDATKLNPYMCSLFYTVDRTIQFNKHLFELYNQEDAIMLCDRYVSANIIYQGSKFDTTQDKKDYFDWMYDVEVNKAGLPKDDITIVLLLPIETSQKLLSKRYNNHEEMKDIHESDIKLLKECYKTAELAVEHLSNKGHNWVEIDCSDETGDIRSLESIENDIWKYVSKVLDNN